MTRLLPFAPSLGLLLAIGCAPAVAPPPDTSADVAAINALTEREMAAFASNDTAALTTIFGGDVLIMRPNEPAIQGHDAMLAWVAALSEQFSVSGGYDTTDVIVSGDLAVQRFAGTLSMTPKAGGDPMSEAVKGVHVLRRQADGSWQIVQDVWNANQPPPMMGAEGQ